MSWSLFLCWYEFIHKEDTMKVQAKDMTNNRIKDLELGRDNRFQSSSGGFAGQWNRTTQYYYKTVLEKHSHG